MVEEYRYRKNDRPAPTARPRASCSTSTTAATKTTTAARSSGALTTSSTSPPATAAEAATRSRTRRTRAACSGRCSASTPSATRRASSDTASRAKPLHRRVRPGRDLRARPAQPLPLLVRQEPPRDRRRRPGPLRGGQLQDDQGSTGRQLRLGRLRGQLPLRGRRHRQPREADLHVLALGRPLLDHGRLRRPRQGPGQPPRPLPLRRPLHGRDPLDPRDSRRRERQLRHRLATGRARLVRHGRARERLRGRERRRVPHRPLRA